MFIEKLYLAPLAEEKILQHGVRKMELETVLFGDEPKYFKARSGRYMGIGFTGRTITIIFEYCDGIATIITSYPTSRWQRNLYERK